MPWRTACLRFSAGSAAEAAHGAHLFIPEAPIFYRGFMARPIAAARKLPGIFRSRRRARISVALERAAAKAAKGAAREGFSRADTNVEAQRGIAKKMCWRSPRAKKTALALVNGMNSRRFLGLSDAELAKVKDFLAENTSSMQAAKSPNDRVLMLEMRARELEFMLKGFQKARARGWREGAKAAAG